MATKIATEKAEAREALLALLKPGDRIYSIIRSVSRSGMSRRIDFYCIVPDWCGNGTAGLQYLSGYMESLGIGSRSRTQQGIRVDGCGMDMAFHCVDWLDHVLWPRGTARGSALRSEVL